jgi:hypothetical protein
MCQVFIAQKMLMKKNNNKNNFLSTVHMNTDTHTHKDTDKYAIKRDILVINKPSPWYHNNASLKFKHVNYVSFTYTETMHRHANDIQVVFTPGEQLHSFKRHHTIHRPLGRIMIVESLKLRKSFW